MNKKLLISLTLIVVVTLGFYIFTKSASKPSLERVSDDSSKNEESSMMKNDDKIMMSKSYSLSDISTHSTAKDCWLTIEGKVYDVTKFIPTHPGGEAILQGCGKDATSMFNSRPNDGTSHSSKARDLLKNFLIGDLSK